MSKNVFSKTLICLFAIGLVLISISTTDYASAATNNTLNIGYITSLDQMLSSPYDIQMNHNEDKPYIAFTDPKFNSEVELAYIESGNIFVNLTQYSSGNMHIVKLALTLQNTSDNKSTPYIAYIDANLHNQLSVLKGVDCENADTCKLVPLTNKIGGGSASLPINVRNIAIQIDRAGDIYVAYVTSSKQIGMIRYNVGENAGWENWIVTNDWQFAAADDLSMQILDYDQHDDPTHGQTPYIGWIADHQDGYLSTAHLMRVTVDPNKGHIWQNVYSQPSYNKPLLTLCPNNTLCMIYGNSNQGLTFVKDNPAQVDSFTNLNYYNRSNSFLVPTGLASDGNAVYTSFFSINSGKSGYHYRTFVSRINITNNLNDYTTLYDTGALMYHEPLLKLLVNQKSMDSNIFGYAFFYCQNKQRANPLNCASASDYVLYKMFYN